jgi:4a-hydroxytetrahydrobiopterin dehydratase
MKKENNDKKCFSCEGRLVSAYTNEEINDQLIKLGGAWKHEKIEKKTSSLDCIHKKYIFKDYISSANFAQSITPIAEQLRHHPEITFSWGYLIARIWTFGVQGLTEMDFVLASKIDYCYFGLVID